MEQQVKLQWMIKGYRAIHFNNVELEEDNSFKEMKIVIKEEIGEK